MREYMHMLYSEKSFVENQKQNPLRNSFREEVTLQN